MRERLAMSLFIFKPPVFESAPWQRMCLSKDFDMKSLLSHGNGPVAE